MISTDRVRQYSTQLEKLLQLHLGATFKINEIHRFSGGYSNLTFRIICENQELVLRQAPPGVHIKGAHDMAREYNILKALDATNVPVPTPYFCIEDTTLLGAPFYVMQKLEGKSLNIHTADKLILTPDIMKELSVQATQKLSDLHQLDVSTLNLGELGRPVGYISRQIEGWIRRYHRSKTDEIRAAQNVETWLEKVAWPEDEAALIHNDYKYDNLILGSTDLTKIVGIVDWEMAAIGHPLMDFGTSLAYWIEPSDPAVLQAFNTTWMPGNLNRKEIVDTYFSHQEKEKVDMTPFIVYGLYKVAVIAQQIYRRHVDGKSQDPRFAALIYIVKASLSKAEEYSEKGI